MIRYRWYRSGDVFGMLYEMEAGSALPRHAHERETLHNVIVLKGAVLFDGDTRRTLDAGEVFDFDGSTLHTTTALAGGATILNLFLHGIPADYKALPDSEHSGVFHG